MEYDAAASLPVWWKEGQWPHRGSEKDTFCQEAAFFYLGSHSDCQPSKEDDSVGTGGIMSYS